MRLQLTTRAQVSGYRFLLRRMDHALLRRDARMISDPMSAQARSLIAGLVIALVLAGGCGVLALIRPQGAVGDAKIVLARDSGALYVRVDDVLHPVTGLASARLFAGEAQQPVAVKDARLASFRRGPLVGIFGAPQQILGPRRPWSGAAEPWAVCDTTTVAPVDRPGSRDEVITTVYAADPGRSVGGAVLARRGDRTYLLYGGRRAPVDLADPLVRRVTGLDPRLARTVGAGVFEALEEAAPIAAPTVPGRGRAVSALPGVPVGAVVRVSDSDRDRLYVALLNGVQEVGAVAADLLRGADSAGDEIRTVPARDVAAAPAVSDLPVGDMPATRPEIDQAAKAPVVCAVLSADGLGGGARELRTLAALPGDIAAVMPATADGSGDAVDAVALPPGTGEYVLAAEPHGERRDALYYVSDSGVRHGIESEDTARVLGLFHSPRPVAWDVLRTLPEGPALTTAAARVTHDG
ncbi:type VII secretion protein EccB [Tsukamurella sp. 8F]|uniref:type VII secretion protein EccB n=1 Tax=unclassified Tsukamurella TaxID=2633480 RepID=UPI0023B9FB92|nr:MULTISPECIES: type VII secretion protein EccB [unclassified Tsukamurella]MDF0531752.1 type VII secretion protein EccB [Tsukamurella sp. 8J]MDF0588046.1 type VII secretion protein EccB [Tsukamurella sp. 8F]